MGEQRLGDARILGDHGFGCGQRRQRAERNVAQIADRGGHDMQARRDPLGLGAQAESREGRRFPRLVRPLLLPPLAHIASFVIPIRSFCL